MSIEDLKGYSKRVQEDPEVKVEAKKLGISDLAGQIDYAKGLGYSFSMEDIQELAKEVAPAEGELSEEDLESVAGGFITVSAAAAVVGAGAAVASSTSGSGW